jgi:hypothetical protein
MFTKNPEREGSTFNPTTSIDTSPNKITDSLFDETLITVELHLRISDYILLVLTIYQHDAQTACMAH